MASVLAVTSALTGCATASKDIATAYVSPVQSQGYDCAQLGMEAQRLTVRMQQLGGRLDEAAHNDAALVGVGVLLFWPVLFAVGGTKSQEAEYARLKREAQALQKAAVSRKCTPGVGEETKASAPETHTLAASPSVKEAFAECVPLPSRVGDKVHVAGLGDVFVKELRTPLKSCVGFGTHSVAAIVTKYLPGAILPAVLSEPPRAAGRAGNATVVERLCELKQLREENLITQEAYEAKQKEMLASH